MKKALIIIGIVIVVLVAVAVAIPFFINVNQFRPTVEAQLTTALGRQVKIGDLSLSLLKGQLGASNITIADDPTFSRNPFVQARALDISVEIMPLIFNRAVHVQSLSLEQPQVALIRSANGTWNFSTIGQGAGAHATPQKTSAPAQKQSGGADTAGGSAMPEIQIQKLEILNGRILLGSTGHRPQAYDAVNLRAENVSYTSRFPFTLTANMPGGGKMDVKGQAGPVDRSDASRTPFAAQANITRLDLAASGLLEPGAGIAGVVDFKGNLKSDGNRAQTKGTVTASKLCMVKGCHPASQPITVDYASDYDLARQTGVVDNTRIVTGKSAVNLAGTYDLRGASPVLHMKANAPSIPVQDVQALLPAMGVVLPEGASFQSGSGDAHMSVDGPLSNLVTTGNVALSNARLAGFSLGSKLAALSALSGINKAASDTVIQTLSSGVRIAPAGINADNLKLIVAGIGTLTGGGTIASNSAMNFKMLLQGGAGSAVSNVLTRVGVGKNAATRGIPFMIQGTTSRPIIVPDVKGMLAGKLGAGQAQQNPAQGVQQMLGNILGKKKKPQ
ncbi:MAG TPA: AsmA family protein [Terriglobales bacterium]|jgi:AsmA protein|nr:AsmA family protein [Terriglobales bacterium]